MPTETHYVIGRDADDHLLYEASEIDIDDDSDDAWENPRIVHGWVRPDSRASLQITSRADAEAKAAEHGGTVRRVTVTTADAGPLRWVERPCMGMCRHWALYDGDVFESTVNTDAEGAKWYCHGWDGVQFAGPFDTLDEAKEAAMAAVRETWT